MYNHTELTMLAAQAGHDAQQIEKALKPTDNYSKLGTFPRLRGIKRASKEHHGNIKGTSREHQKST